MKTLIWLNGIGLIIFGTFSAGLAWVYWGILPKIGFLQMPPVDVQQAISQTSDLEGLRQMAAVLLNHLTVQTTEINNIFYIVVFGLFVYGSIVVLLVTGNLAVIYHYKKFNK